MKPQGWGPKPRDRRRWFLPEKLVNVSAALTVRVGVYLQRETKKQSSNEGVKEEFF